MKIVYASLCSFIFAIYVVWNMNKNDHNNQSDDIPMIACFGIIISVGYVPIVVLTHSKNRFALFFTFDCLSGKCFFEQSLL